MTTELLLEGLLKLTLLSSAALLMLAALRPVLQRACGARTTYAAWLLVPLMLLSPWLPAASAPASLPLAWHAVTALPTLTPSTPAPGLDGAMPAVAESLLTWPLACMLAWAAGAMGLAAVLWRSQRRFVRTLQQRADGTWQAPAGHSPAVIGVWPARLVLPADFEQRFDAQCQRLMLAHEAVHLRRHDTAWNLLAAGLLCLQWFNPLAWWGWQRLRVDQELACDEAVLDATPALRAAYASALLQAHRGPRHPALASSWATRHPLVQRVQRLTRHRPVSPLRRLGGGLLLAGLGLGAALLARAAQVPAPGPAQPARAPAVLVFDVESQVGDARWQHQQVRVPLPRPSAGNPAGVMVQAMQPGWCLHLSLYAFGDGEVRPTALPMDETCQRPLGEGRTLNADGRVAQFAARTAQGALQAQVVMRQMTAAQADNPALSHQDASAGLSPEQRLAMARAQEGFASTQQQLAAQDRAWRAAREAQSGTR